MRCPRCGGFLTPRLEVAMEMCITGEGNDGVTGGATANEQRVVYDCSCGFSCEAVDMEDADDGKSEKI